MRKAFIRTVALLLVSCLVVDHTLAAISFSKTSAFGRLELFQEQALVARVLAGVGIRFGQTPQSDAITFFSRLRGEWGGVGNPPTPENPVLLVRDPLGSLKPKIQRQVQRSKLFSRYVISTGKQTTVRLLANNGVEITLSGSDQPLDELADILDYLSDFPKWPNQTMKTKYQKQHRILGQNFKALYQESLSKSLGYERSKFLIYRLIDLFETQLQMDVHGLVGAIDQIFENSYGTDYAKWPAQAWQSYTVDVLDALNALLHDRGWFLALTNESFAYLRINASAHVLLGGNPIVMFDLADPQGHVLPEGVLAIGRGAQILLQNRDLERNALFWQRHFEYDPFAADNLIGQRFRSMHLSVDVIKELLSEKALREVLVVQKSASAVNRFLDTEQLPQDIIEAVFGAPQVRSQFMDDVARGLLQAYQEEKIPQTKDSLIQLVFRARTIALNLSRASSPTALQYAMYRNVHAIHQKQDVTFRENYQAMQIVYSCFVRSVYHVMSAEEKDSNDEPLMQKSVEQQEPQVVWDATRKMNKKTAINSWLSPGSSTVQLLLASLLPLARGLFFDMAGPLLVGLIGFDLLPDWGKSALVAVGLLIVIFSWLGLRQWFFAHRLAFELGLRSTEDLKKQYPPLTWAKLQVWRDSLLRKGLETEFDSLNIQKRISIWREIRQFALESDKNTTFLFQFLDVMEVDMRVYEEGAKTRDEVFATRMIDAMYDVVADNFIPSELISKIYVAYQTSNWVTDGRNVVAQLNRIVQVWPLMWRWMVKSKPPTNFLFEMTSVLALGLFGLLHPHVFSASLFDVTWPSWSQLLVVIIALSGWAVILAKWLLARYKRRAADEFRRSHYARIRYRIITRGFGPQNVLDQFLRSKGVPEPILANKAARLKLTPLEESLFNQFESLETHIETYLLKGNEPNAEEDPLLQAIRQEVDVFDRLNFVFSLSNFRPAVADLLLHAADRYPHRVEVLRPALGEIFWDMNRVDLRLATPVMPEPVGGMSPMAQSSRIAILFMAAWLGSEIFAEASPLVAPSAPAPWIAVSPFLVTGLAGGLWMVLHRIHRIRPHEVFKRFTLPAAIFLQRAA